MKRVLLEIEENVPLTADVVRMVLRGDVSEVTRAGQFVNIAIDGLYLRRPISVCDFTADSLEIIYKVVGEGTSRMAAMRRGERLDVLTGLGNGFDTEHDCRRPLLVGGGVGIPPLYRLAKDLAARGREVTAILGFNRAGEVFYADEFRAAGAEVIVTTADGSYGRKGLVTDEVREREGRFDYFYACGPVPMLRALCDATATDGEMSFEERMGCGFGACMGCSCKTVSGSKRICKDGPVLRRAEVIWE